MKSSVSIALFFLLSGFFLSSLLGALEHSRKLLGSAAVCFVAVACVIVFLLPIHLPSWGFGSGRGGNATSTTATTVVGPAVLTTVTTLGVMVGTTVVSTVGTMAGPLITMGVPDAQLR